MDIKIKAHDMSRSYLNLQINHQLYQLLNQKQSEQINDEYNEDESMDETLSEFEEMNESARETWIVSYMEKHIEKVTKEYPLPQVPGNCNGDYDLYEGYGGVAYMFYHLSDRMNIIINKLQQDIIYAEQNHINDIELIRMKQYLHSQIEKQQLYIHQGIEYIEYILSIISNKLERVHHHREPITFICGISGPYVLGILLYTLKLEHISGIGITPRSNSAGWNTEYFIQQRIYCMNSLLSLCPSHHDIPYELLYGQSGYLYSCIFVLKRLTSLHTNINNVSINTSNTSNSSISSLTIDTSAQPIDETLVSFMDKLRHIIDKVFDQIITAGQTSHHSSSSLMWKWHEKEYLGAAHGITGIIHTLLQVDWKCTNEIIQLIESTMSYVHTQLLDSGNLRSSPNNHTDRLVQWCHGAPAYSLCCCELYRITKQVHYLQLAIQSSEIVWERGLLKKGLGLCHGLSGNAYVFLTLYHLTGNEVHLRRCWYFVRFGVIGEHTRQLKRQPDVPQSLFNGIAATVPLYADLITKFKRCCFPGFQL